MIGISRFLQLWHITHCQHFIHSASKHFGVSVWLNFDVQFRTLAASNLQLWWNFTSLWTLVWELSFPQQFTFIQRSLAFHVSHKHIPFSDCTVHHCYFCSFPNHLAHKYNGQLPFSYWCLQPLDLDTLQPLMYSQVWTCSSQWQCICSTANL